MPRVTIQLEAGDTSFPVTVEPWAAPSFEVRPGERCAVVVDHPTCDPTVTCSVIRGALCVTVYESGSTFAFVRDGTVEFGMPNQIATQVRSGLSLPSGRRWVQLALVFGPANVLAAIARGVDPVDRVLTGTGNVWYSQQRQLALWLFVGAFGWLLFSLVILWLRSRSTALR